MKRTNYKYCILFGLQMLVQAGIVPMMAQVPNNEIKGKIVDGKGSAVEFVNIVLLSVPDSAFQQGTTSDMNGAFCMTTTVTDGVLKVSSVGYTTKYVGLHDFKGEIQLNEELRMLGEVTVKGQHPKTKLTGNSMVTEIEGTVLGQSGSASEMLSKVPGMAQRGDDLEVLGRGKPLFYINGRKVQDLDELKRLRSEEIKEVEVITNPGAQYDATITSVVRIKTIRQQGVGLGYDIIASNNQDLRYGYANPGTTLNLRYRYKSFDVFGMAQYWEYSSVNDSKPIQWSYLKKDDKLATIEQENYLRNDWKGRGMNYNLGFNWQINDNHSIGMRVERHDRLKTGTEAWIGTDMLMYNQDRENPLAEEHSQSHQYMNDSQPYNWEGNAYYNGKAGKLGIDLNVDFVSNKTNTNDDIEEIADKTISTMNSVTNIENRMIADKLILSYPVWKGILQAGTEMSFVTRKTGYQIQGVSLPATKADVSEDNIAAFLEYACQIPTIGNISAGLRYEHIDFDYNDLLNAEGSMSRSTDDFFPSISWSRQFGSLQASLSYAVKTERPNYDMMDESMIYINSYTLVQGDSKLKNSYASEVSANVRWKWLNLYMAYERRKNTLTQWSYLYNDNGMILQKNINLDIPLRNFAAFLTATPTWGVYSPNWTAGIQKFFVTNTLVDPREESGTRDVHYRKPIFFFDLNNAFRLKHSWQLECNMNIMTRGDVMNFRMTSTSANLSLAVQKSWLKNDALTLRATLGDVFQCSTQNIELDCGYYLIKQHSQFSRHCLGITLRYSFNASPSKYKGTGAGKDTVNRMENKN